MGVIDAALADGVTQHVDGVEAGGSELKQVALESGPGGFAGEEQDELVGLVIEPSAGVRAEVVLGGQS